MDLRVSALTRASQRILENLGVWNRMSEMRISPYRGMLVWDATGSGSIEFDAAEIGEPDLGHIVENRVTQLALWERLGEIGNVCRLCPDSVHRLELGGERPWLELNSGRRIEAQLDCCGGWCKLHGQGVGRHRMQRLELRSARDCRNRTAGKTPR